GRAVQDVAPVRAEDTAATHHPAHADHGPDDEEAGEDPAHSGTEKDGTITGQSLARLRERGFPWSRLGHRRAGGRGRGRGGASARRGLRRAQRMPCEERPSIWSSWPGTGCAPSSPSATMRLLASTCTTRGRCAAISSASSCPYAMMITRSPGETRWAAAPLMPITPLPRSPSMTYVTRR